MNSERKIGIVDDHNLFRSGIASLINLFPNTKVLFEAGNGKQMIESINPEELPEIVLMDIEMPEMDGYESTSWLATEYPDVKVIALSTMDSETNIIRMIKSGAKGYMLKDSSTEELKRAFDDVLSIGYFYNEVVTRKVLGAISQITDVANAAATFVKLSERDVEFLKLTCSELAYKEIADKMGVSARTVEGYRDTLCEKLGLKTRTGLAIYAIKNRLVPLNSL